MRVSAEPLPESPQLLLPIPGLGAAEASGAVIPRADRVFVNRSLRMSTIEWIGFDMDYTLAIYDQEQIDLLSIRSAIERLVALGYPEYLAAIECDTRFPIRGLLVDRRHGHLLKMNRYKYVRRGFHGMTPLAKETLRELYHHEKIRPHTARYHWIDTLFSLSEVTSYGAVVSAMEQRGERVDYSQLFDDIRRCIDAAHADGAVHRTVTGNLGRYIHSDPGLARTLHKFRSAGKKLFLLTNSPWEYTDAVLTHVLGGSLPEYRSWRQFFDVAIVGAQKPTWFKEGRPLMEREGDLLRRARPPLERGKIYEGGNLRELERLLGVPSSMILYVGDHIYGDMLRSKKESAWRTAMIIQELDAEVAAHQSSAVDTARRRRLDEWREKLEEELRFCQTRFKDLAKLDSDPAAQAERVRQKRAIDHVRAELRSLEREHAVVSQRIDLAFHPYWGSLLKEQGEMSMFGLQVETYADLYMRRVSSFSHYSPQQYFRSPHDLMSHEI